MRILSVVGARPQFIKAAVLSRSIAAFNDGVMSHRRIQEIMVHTGQHYDDNMSAVFFKELNIPSPAYDLGVGSGPHGQQTGRMLESLERVMEQEQPDLVMVYGDTNSTLASALAASKLKIPVAHVEAGLRSYNPAMAEEINRVIADHLSTWLFCPTERSVKNLSCEGISHGVHLVGDVMYDSLLYHLERVSGRTEILTSVGVVPGQYGLATVHRAENTEDGEKLRALMTALACIGLPIVVPLHPRTKAAFESVDPLPPSGNLRLIAPVSYYDMLLLERHAGMVLTDSGGVQKEAFFLGVPCVTLRNETEWVETVEAGWNRLAGTQPDAIVAAAHKVLESRLPDPGKPYGDGHAAEAILRIIADNCPKDG